MSRPWRECAYCGSHRCYWHLDAWVCDNCGSEWYPDHGAVYDPPDDDEGGDVPMP